MCRTYGDENYRRGHAGSFTTAQLQRIARIFFNRALHITFGCIAEPTLHKDLPGLVNLAKKHKIPFVSVVTNGQLLTEKTLYGLLANHLDELILSIHGVNKKSYERFMVGASYEKLHTLFCTIANLQRQGVFTTCKLRLNYVLNSENLEELGSFFEVFGKYKFDILQIRPMIACNFLDTGDISYKPGYATIFDVIKRECRQRNILLLAEEKKIAERNETYFFRILPAIYRYISPGEVWNKDFNWQTETYTQYCRKKRYSKFLLKAIFSNNEDLIHFDNPEFHHSLKYSVM
jgi:molybdenum cofactor biosynthesis enzyme MoaA